MSIEMPAAELYALANMLRGSAADAEEIGGRLEGTPQVGGGLQPAVDAFLENHRMAGRALAGELQSLGSDIAAVADSWLRLDTAILAPYGRARAE
jgi:hypothetical protein